MKAFVSSLITGMEAFREAAREAVETARFVPVMAEDFGALPATPQIACLSGLRDSDVVVLVLGEHYGVEQRSGLSATHEEWREAQDRKPVLVFVQDDVSREPRQADLVREVEGWAEGRFRAGFKTPRDLRVAIGGALMDFERANAVGPIDEAALTSRAVALLPVASGHSYSSASLSLAIAGGPTQQILRPVEIENPVLWDALHQAAMFGDTKVFDQAKGVDKRMEGAALSLRQGRDGALIRLDEQGGQVMQMGLDSRSAGIAAPAGFSSLPVLLEEIVAAQLAAALTYAGWALERIDPTQKLTHVAVAARIEGGTHLGWRTLDEHAASPNSVSMNMTSGERSAVQLSARRAALRLDRTRLVEDLLVPLRRQAKGR